MPAPSRKKILIIDDDEPAAEELVDFLRCRLDAELRVAHSVAAARALIETDTPFDLCLIDIRMPRESGMALVELLRRDDRATARPDIILMSGFHDTATLEMIQKQELPFLPKPIMPGRLLELLGSGIGRQTN